jgi:hypothetical protein
MFVVNHCPKLLEEGVRYGTSAHILTWYVGCARSRLSQERLKRIILRSDDKQVAIFNRAGISACGLQTLGRDL